MINTCCRLTPEQNQRLDQITVYVRKLLEEGKSPREIAKEEDISEDEVRKAFSEILDLTGNEKAVEQINEAIAKLSSKE